MNRFCALVVLSLLAVAPAYADTDRGVAAFERGDYQTALGELRPPAAAGDARAQYYLGLLYYHGDVAAWDETAAAEWFHKAAAQGSLQAQARLGKVYYWGKGVTQDHVKAEQFYRTAAERGDAHAQSMLAEMYASGQGVAQDSKAAAWYHQAADQGYALAQTALSFIYTEGKGVKQDFVQALKWTNLAGAQNEFIATMFRNHLTFRMSDEEIAEADRLAHEWKPAPGP